jgi:hypothetical protein
LTGKATGHGRFLPDSTMHRCSSTLDIKLHVALCCMRLMREYTSGVVLAFISELGAMPTFVSDVYAERTAKDTRKALETIFKSGHTGTQRVETFLLYWYE